MAFIAFVLIMGKLKNNLPFTSMFGLTKISFFFSSSSNFIPRHQKKCHRKWIHYGIMHRQRGFTYKIIILFNQNWFFSRNMVFFTRNYFQSELLIGRILFGFLFSFSIFFSLQDYSHVYTFYSSKTKREWIFFIIYFHIGIFF